MTEDIEDSARFKPRDGLVLEEIDDEVVILDLQKNVYFGLNPVGRLVWSGIREDKNVAQIVDTLVEDFDVEREVVAQDVRDFIEEALSNELIAEA